MTKAGVIYVAHGSRYAQEAVFSASSIRNHCSLPITLFTDEDIKSDLFENIITINPSHKRAKIDYISKSPYDRTLFLDSGTKVVSDISDLFAILDRFDFAAVQDHCRKGSRWSKVVPEYASIPYAFPEYNSGVMLYRSNIAIERLFSTWREYFYKYQSATDG